MSASRIRPGTVLLSDEESNLIARLRAGDRDGFDHLVLAYHGELHAYVTRWTGSEAVASDVLQEMFLHCWRTRATLAIPYGLRPFLYAATRGYVLRYLRGERRLAAREAAYAAEQELSSAQNSPDRDELVEVARAAVEQLPTRSREVWRLCREQELTYNEAAAVLGISVNTVKTLMGRSLRAVRDAIAPFLTLMLMVQA